jgi:hypothetical protein
MFDVRSGLRRAPARFRLNGVIDGRRVEANLAEGRLTCSRALWERAVAIVGHDDMSRFGAAEFVVPPLQNPFVTLLAFVCACDTKTATIEWPR